MSPRLLTPAIPVSVGIRMPREFGSGAFGTTPVPAENNLRPFAFFFYTFNLADPNDFDSIICTRMQKGANYSRFDDALRARITNRGGTPDDEIKYYTAQTGGTESAAGQFVELRKKAALDAARMMGPKGIAVFGHSPPKEHLEYAAAEGTTVGTALHNLESINQGPEFNPILDQERAELIDDSYILAPKATSGCNADGLAAYGCPVIDKSEASDASNPNVCTPGTTWTANSIACPHSTPHAGLPSAATPGFKHSWDIDMRFLNEFLPGVLTAQQAKLQTHYVGADGKYVVRLQINDNHAQNKFKGTSSCQYPDDYTDAVYQAFTKEADAQIIGFWSADTKVHDASFFHWANCTDLEGVYSVNDLRNRWVEFFFVDPSGASARPWLGTNGIQNALQRAKASGLRIALGMTGTFQGQNSWATTTGGPVPAVNGRWTDIVNQVRADNSFENVYVQVLRQTAGGYCFHQDGIAPFA